VCPAIQSQKPLAPYLDISHVRCSAWLGCYGACWYCLVSDGGKMSPGHGLWESVCKVAVMTGKASPTSIRDDARRDLGANHFSKTLGDRDKPSCSPTTEPSIVCDPLRLHHKDSCAIASHDGIMHGANLARFVSVYRTTPT